MNPELDPLAARQPAPSASIALLETDIISVVRTIPRGWGYIMKTLDIVIWSIAIRYAKQPCAGWLLQEVLHYPA